MHREYMAIMGCLLIPMWFVGAALEVAKNGCPSGTVAKSVRLLPFERVCVKRAEIPAQNSPAQKRVI